MLFPDLAAGGALGPFGGSAADVITGRKRPCVAPEGRGCGEGAGPHWMVFAPGGGAYGEWVWPEGVGETLLDGVYLWGRGLWEGAGLNRGGGASLGGVCPWGRGLTGGVGLQTGGVCPHLATSWPPVHPTWPPVGHQFNPLATSCSQLPISSYKLPPVHPIGHQFTPVAHQFNPVGHQFYPLATGCLQLPTSSHQLATSLPYWPPVAPSSPQLATSRSQFTPMPTSGPHRLPWEAKWWAELREQAWPSGRMWACPR